MTVISLFKIIELKKQIVEKFGINMHVHDASPSQFFSFDEKVSDELKEFVKEFFKSEKVRIVFSSDGLEFHPEDV